MHGPFHIIGNIEVKKNGTTFLDQKRIDLLRCIRHTGSIRSASMTMNMSYQQAWSSIKIMNALSPLPIVIKRRGGARGGGAEVTNYGVTLIRNFLKTKQQHTEYLQGLDDIWKDCLL
jgi:molybdate transport system regulatory protein